MNSQPVSPEAIGVASVCLCQNLLQLLIDRSVITATEVQQILGEAAKENESVSGYPTNLEAARLLREIAAAMAAQIRG